MPSTRVLVQRVGVASATFLHRRIVRSRLAGVGALTVAGALLTTDKALFGVLLLGIGLVIEGLLEWWSRRLRGDGDLAQGRDSLLEENLAPLLAFAATSTKHDRVDRLRNAESGARRAASDLKSAFSSVDGVRVVVFVVSDDGERMEPYPPARRQVRPGDFQRGTLRGDRAFELLDAPQSYVLVDDLDAGTHRTDWAGTGEGYRTFITAPIRSEDEGFGLLTIDAPSPGTLDDRHASTLALYAAALGVLFSDAARLP